MKTQFGDKAMKCPLSFDSIDLITFNYYVYIDRARGICGLVWAELWWPTQVKSECETKVTLKGCYNSANTQIAREKLGTLYLLINNWFVDKYPWTVHD